MNECVLERSTFGGKRCNRGRWFTLAGVGCALVNLTSWADLQVPWVICVIDGTWIITTVDSVSPTLAHQAKCIFILRTKRCPLSIILSDVEAKRRQAVFFFFHFCQPSKWDSFVQRWAREFIFRIFPMHGCELRKPAVLFLIWIFLRLFCGTQKFHRTFEVVALVALVITPAADAYVMSHKRQRKGVLSVWILTEHPLLFLLWFNDMSLCLSLLNFFLHDHDSCHVSELHRWRSTSLWTAISSQSVVRLNDLLKRVESCLLIFQLFFQIFYLNFLKGPFDPHCSLAVPLMVIAKHTNLLDDVPFPPERLRATGGVPLGDGIIWLWAEFTISHCFF